MSNKARPPRGSRQPPSRTEGSRNGWAGPLAALAVAYGVAHHVGTLLEPAGRVGDTGWADWVDVLTPYAMVGLAAWTLASTQAPTSPGTGPTPRNRWLVFVFGAILYVQGHGIHLSANSIDNVAPSGIAHFWDEFVGHYFWYLGLATVFAVLAHALANEAKPRNAWIGHVLSASAGITHFTNSIQGHFAVAGLVVASMFAIWGFRTRHGMGVFLLTAYGLAVALFAIYGITQRGFPEFSEGSWT